MARNLKYQFKYAIDRSCKLGADKHSIKRNNIESNNRGKVTYSYSDRRNLIDVSANFSNWMKKNYSEIKEVKDITSNHIQKFLEEKSHSCTSATIKQYESKFSKLEKLVNDTYENANVNYSNTITPACIENTKLRDISMNERDYRRLLDYAKNNCRSLTTYNSLQLSYNAGLRVSEIAKLQKRDIRINSNSTVTVHIEDGKGGRNRDIYITNKQSVKALIDIRNSVEEEYSRVVPVQSESINKALSRAMDKCNMQRYKKHKTSVHSIRKTFAQNQYELYKRAGLEPREAWNKVSEQLGHGRGREDLYKVYIENN